MSFAAGAGWILQSGLRLFGLNDAKGCLDNLLLREKHVEFHFALRVREALLWCCRVLFNFTARIWT